MNSRVKSKAVLALFRYAGRELKDGRQKRFQSKESRKVEIRELIIRRGRDEVSASIPNAILPSNSSCPEIHPSYLFFSEIAL